MHSLFLILFLATITSCSTTRINFNHKVPPLFKVTKDKHVSVKNLRGRHAEQIKQILEETLLEEGITVLDNNYCLELSNFLTS
ncbi:MAG: hypothetical protein AB8G05_05390 [Oligoflexales bacterium]